MTENKNNVIVHPNFLPRIMSVEECTSAGTTKPINTKESPTNTSPSQTKSPPKKRSKPTYSGKKVKARCSLMNYTQFKNGDSPDLTHQPEEVPRWGGTALLDGNAMVKLINTCPIDNYLTIFYLYLKHNSTILEQLKVSAARYAKCCLVDVVSAFDKSNFSTGKVIWLKQFPKFNFKTPGTVDVWGCELDMIMPCLAPILSSTLKTHCNANDCPQKERSVHRKSIFITPLDLKLNSDQFMQQIVNEWLSPPPKECNVVTDSLTDVDGKLSELELILPRDNGTDSNRCEGIVTSKTRVFLQWLPMGVTIIL